MGLFETHCNSIAEALSEIFGFSLIAIDVTPDKFIHTANGDVKFCCQIHRTFAVHVSGIDFKVALVFFRNFIVYRLSWLDHAEIKPSQHDAHRLWNIGGGYGLEAPRVLKSDNQAITLI